MFLLVFVYVGMWTLVGEYTESFGLLTAKA
jgi:hypothetical protein